MLESATGVLRTIANRLGCQVDDIESWLGEFYGDGVDVPRFAGAEERLSWIRRRLNAGEGESVTWRAAEIRHQRNQELDA